MSPVKTRLILFFGRTCSSLCFQCADDFPWWSTFLTSEEGGEGDGTRSGFSEAMISPCTSTAKVGMHQRRQDAKD